MRDLFVAGTVTPDGFRTLLQQTENARKLAQIRRGGDKVPLDALCCRGIETGLVGLAIEGCQEVEERRDRPRRIEVVIHGGEEGACRVRQFLVEQAFGRVERGVRRRDVRVATRGALDAFDEAVKGVEGLLRRFETVRREVHRAAVVGLQDEESDHLGRILRQEFG